MESRDEEESVRLGTAEAAEVPEVQLGVVPPMKTMQHKWTLWFEKKSQEKSNQILRKADYLKELKKAGSFQTIPSFWSCWNEVQDICNVSAESQGANYHLFRDNIQPVWEHPKNLKGGKWVIAFPSTFSPQDVMRNWMSLMLTLLLGEFGYDSEINGAVLAVRPWGSTFSIWNRNANDREVVEAVSHKLKEVLGVEYVKYQRHQFSMRRNNERAQHSRPKRLNHSSDESASSNDGSSSSEGEENSLRPVRRSVISDTPREALCEIANSNIQAPIHQGTLEETELKSVQELQPANEIEAVKEAEVTMKPEVVSVQEAEPLEGYESPETAKNRRRRRKANAQKKAVPLRDTQEPKIRAVTPKKLESSLDAIPVAKLGLGLVLVAAGSAISWALYL